MTNAKDAGTGSLRQGVFDARESPGADGIEFSLDVSTPQTIPLAFRCWSRTTWTSSRPDRLTVNASRNGRVFVGAQGTTVSIEGHGCIDGKATSGAGISCAGAMTITDCVFTDNEATDEGAALGNLGTLTVVGTTASRNLGDDAAGCTYNDGGSLTVLDSTISDNRADDGGGIYSRGGTLTIRNSTISDNSAGDGGGILAASTTTIANTTVSSNFAGRGGLSSDGPVTILDPTFSRNAALVGGGIHHDSGPLTTGNTIVAYSLLGGSIVGTVTSLGLSIPSDSTGFDPATTPTDKINTDPKLLVLTDRGGPTSTHALALGSPATDAGDRTLVPSGVTADQRETGLPRVINGKVDVGAFEAPATPPVGSAGVVSVIQGGFRRNLVTGRYVQLLTLANAGTTTFQGPVSLILDGLTAGVSLYQPTGAANGSPYRNAGLGSDGVPSPGEKVTVTLEFVNPMARSIAYTLRVLAGPGPRKGSDGCGQLR